MTETTITAADIRTLRHEAAAAGDTAMRITCDMALDGEDSHYDDECLDADGRPDYSGGGHADHELRAIREALRLTADEAWARCVDAIEEAKA